MTTSPTDQLLPHDKIDLTGDSALDYMHAKRGNLLRMEASAYAWGVKGQIAK